MGAIIAKTETSKACEIVSAGEERVIIEVDGARHVLTWSHLREAADQDDPILREAYTRMLQAAIIQRDRQVEDARLAKVTACTGHAVQRTSEPRGYRGSVAVHPYTEENRAAHGGCEYTEFCRCGAKRKRLGNGRHVEMGVWR